MASAGYTRFIESMNIDYYKWHDGEPYDIAALRELTAGERKQVEKILVGRADRDWRDLDALAALGSPAAWKAVESVAHSAGEQALHAAKLLQERDKNQPGSPAAALVERQIIAGLLNAKDGLVSQLIDAAAQHDTPAVRAALLHAARHSASGTLRVHAAALLFFLHRLAAEPFDWKHRPFFLRFAASDPQALNAAHLELMARLSAAPLK